MKAYEESTKVTQRCHCVKNITMAERRIPKFSAWNLFTTKLPRLAEFCSNRPHKRVSLWSSLYVGKLSQPQNSLQNVSHCHRLIHHVSVSIRLAAKVWDIKYRNISYVILVHINSRHKPTFYTGACIYSSKMLAALLVRCGVEWGAGGVRGENWYSSSPWELTRLTRFLRDQGNGVTQSLCWPSEQWCGLQAILTLVPCFMSSVEV
jgi:hypothetical protein